MGVRNRVREVGEAASSAVVNLGRGVVERGIHARRVGANASGEWVLGVLGALPAPAAPASEQWEFSLGALVCKHPRVPAVTARALRAFDGIGALRFGPESVGFEGEDIPWKKVTGLRLHDAFSAMTTDALDTEADRIREVLPPLPGRKWAVTKVVEGLATVMLAALEQASEQRLNHVNVACEVTYRGALGREKSLRANLFTTALLAHQLDVAHSLVVTAQEMGVPVLPADPAGAPVQAMERVRALRERTDAMAADLAARDEDDPGREADGSTRTGGDAGHRAGPDPGSDGAGDGGPSRG
ncbi:hypothetical protein [Streptomyces zagrosensis]|uniref:Uncharacterized protein n=1 Tax=Streptomyces zagrosensis TaxID=1042984 RepID=A0A7W9Q6S9_9ACTN|nr:hypothetical protein [Streptomyces zagrosensis]MBB5934688.1 hypothetical protein [Streptomyces zagrosensis]